jgi:hypothetical protein
MTQKLKKGHAYPPLIGTYKLKTNTASHICLELFHASFPNHTQFLTTCHRYLEWRIYITINFSHSQNLQRIKLHMGFMCLAEV